MRTLLLIWSDGASLHGPDPAAVRYNGLSATETEHWLEQPQFVATPAPCAFTLKRLSVRFTAAPGAGKSWTVDVLKNGVATGIQVVVADAATTGSDFVNTAAIAEDDYVCYRVTPSGTPATAFMGASIEADAAANTSMILGGIGNAGISDYGGAGGVFYNVQSTGDEADGGDMNNDSVIRVAGRISNWKLWIGGAPGSGTRTWQIWVNGAPSGLEIALTGATTSGEDATHSVDVVAGDVVTIQLKNTSGPVSADYAGWGMLFEPTTDGECPIMGGTVFGGSNSATRYFGFGGLYAYSSTESPAQAPVPAGWTFDSAQAKMATAPGTGKSWTWAWRLNGVDKLTVQIADAATEGHDTTNTLATTVDGDLVSISQTPAGTPGNFTGRATGCRAVFTEPVVSPSPMRGAMMAACA